MATCTIFTNVTRLKFPYENRLVEISRESYEKIVYNRCPNGQMDRRPAYIKNVRSMTDAR